jgi:hypothetical protein
MGPRATHIRKVLDGCNCSDYRRFFGVFMYPGRRDRMLMARWDLVMDFVLWVCFGVAMSLAYFSFMVLRLNYPVSS